MMREAWPLSSPEPKLREPALCIGGHVTAVFIDPVVTDRRYRVWLTAGSAGNIRAGILDPD
jgi:hypothetical protein